MILIFWAFSFATTPFEASFLGETALFSIEIMQPFIEYLFRHHFWLHLLSFTFFSDFFFPFTSFSNIEISSPSTKHLLGFIPIFLILSSVHSFIIIIWEVMAPSSEANLRLIFHDP